MVLLQKLCKNIFLPKMIKNINWIFWKMSIVLNIHILGFKDIGNIETIKFCIWLCDICIYVYITTIIKIVDDI